MRTGRRGVGLLCALMVVGASFVGLQAGPAQAATMPPRHAQAAPLPSGAVTMAAPATGPVVSAAVEGDRLVADGAAAELAPGAQLTSRTGGYRLVMQPDGNLVQYAPHGRPLWSSGTGGNPGALAALQPDGNLVVYRAGRPLWWSGTSSRGRVDLVVQPDANLVLYSSAGPRWATYSRDDRLLAGGVLQGGQQLRAGGFTLAMQSDGNLVEYGAGRALWSSGTSGNPGARVALQSDGNLVVYSAAGQPLWWSGTAGAGAGELIVRADGPLDLVAGGRTVWTTRPPIQVPQRGSGTFTPAYFPAGTGPNHAGRVVRFSVEIEGGVYVGDPTAFAGAVATTLQDGRGWQGLDGVRLVPVDAAQLAAGTPVDIRVTLASPATVDAQCAPLPTGGELSCWNGRRAMINAKRWVQGAATYGSDLPNYRIYLISHEVGHGLGHHHVGCPGAGQRAPVMVQQSISLYGCTAWPWPRR